jgi:hypothetical protein
MPAAPQNPLERHPGGDGNRPWPPPCVDPHHRVLANILHQRLALPQTAIAALFNVRPETINRRIRDIHKLLAASAWGLPG